MPSKESYIPEVIEYGASKKNYITTTRFNSQTWKENREYMAKNTKFGCIYGVTEPNRQSIPTESYLFVLEMNNDSNRIMGIGLVRNNPLYNRHMVYSEAKYNQFAYVGKYRIDRSEMDEMEERIMKVFDILCFKGARHLKRLTGVKAFPLDILYKCSRLIDLIDFISTMFKKRF